MPRRTSRPASGLWRLLSAPLLLFLLLPLVALLARTSLAQIQSSLAERDVTDAIGLSLITTLISLALILAFGTPIAYALAIKKGRAEKLIDTVIDLPTVLPPSVAGIALLLAFGRMGLVGSYFNAWFGLSVAFTQAAVILAQVFVASPFYIKAAAIALGNVDVDLKQAAALDGATAWQVFTHITLPLAWSGLVSGAVMSWARALGEFGATILFAGNLPGVTQTMPLAIYLGFESNLDIAITLSVILLACSLGALLLAKALLARED
ncbi:MAG: molybdate ABC transporter permease subunit [Anaerolineae bacterium]|nr:molybdate ABC transporter permease subunit [Anaerolineae bacterium]